MKNSSPVCCVMTSCRSSVLDHRYSFTRLSKHLAAQFRNPKLVVNKLINEDQVGYLKGRNLSNILRTIDDVIDYLNMSDKAGYPLALDYCKAFDSVSKDFIIEAFKLFGFGEQFTKWVKTLFSGREKGGEGE